MRIFVTSFLFIIGCVFFATCKRGNVNIDRSIAKYLINNNLKGSFGMFDNGHGQFYIYDYNGYKDSAYLPATTFNMVNALIALETGVATNDSTIIPWDGIKTNNELLNKDLMLSEIFKLNSTAHFSTLAKTIGPNYMRKYLDSIKIGNYKAVTDDTATFNKNIDQFWLNNNLKVKPDEMLGFVKKLYFSQLRGFQKRSHQIVTKMMLQEKLDTTFSLSYKTGIGVSYNNQQVSWVAGWVEENHHPYFFVLNLVSTDVTRKDLDVTAVKIIKKILTEKGFFKGKK